MRVIEKTVFTYSELSEDAQEKAREWWRSCDVGDNFWSEHVIDDAKTIGALMGFDITGVYWSGFWSQGDGACFEGSIGYAKGCLRTVMAHAPTDTELHAIAKAWQKLQARYFYRITGSVRHRGRYSHEQSTEFSFDDIPESAEDDAADIARDYMRWIYSRLENEYEYQNSDDVVAENITVNGYEFDENGKRV